MISIAATRILAEAVEADAVASLADDGVAVLVQLHQRLDDADAGRAWLERIEADIGALTVSAARCRRHAARCRLRAAAAVGTGRA